MLESPKAFDLASLVLLPNGCLLPINETQALNRKYPARGDLQSLSSGPALKAALATALEAERKGEDLSEDTADTLAAELLRLRTLAQSTVTA